MTNSRIKLSSASKWINKNRAGFLFILPALILYIIFFIKPFLTSIYFSMTSWNGADPIKTFIGLENYINLFQDKNLWSALSHNLIWVVIGTIGPIIIGLPLAVLLSSINRGRLIFRTAYFMPYILSGVVIGMIWNWIYNPIFGLLNYILKTIGLDSLTAGWLGDPNLALYCVIVATIWGSFGFCLVIFMAGLQNIDNDLIEAAKIDGANTIQRFINVIIPQLRHVLNMVIVLYLIHGFNVFDIVRIMTQGGPANHSEVIGTYTYEMAFHQNQVGYGTTLSMVMTVLSMLISYIYITLRDRKE